MTCSVCGRALRLTWEQAQKVCSKCQWATPDGKERIREYIKAFGRFKKVVEVGTGVARAVPTEKIVVDGIRGSDLPKFDEWSDERHGSPVEGRN